MPIGVLSFLRQRTQNVISDWGRSFNQFNNTFRGPDLIQKASNRVRQQAPQAYQNFTQNFRNTPFPVPFLSPQVKRPTIGQVSNFANQQAGQVWNPIFQAASQHRLGDRSSVEAAMNMIPFGGTSKLGAKGLDEAYQALNHHYSALVGKSGQIFSKEHLDKVVTRFSKQRPHPANEVFHNEAIRLSHYIDAVKKGVTVNSPFGLAAQGIRDRQGGLKVSSRIATEDPLPRVKLNITGITEKDRVASARTNAVRIKNEISVKGKDAYRIGTKLSPQDLKLAERYQEGVPVNELAKQAKNPKGFTSFMNKIVDYYDFRLQADRAVGGNTPLRENYLRQVWDLGNPQKLAQFNEIAQQRGVRPWNGFSAQPRVFKTYAEGEAAGFKRANPNILGDLQTDYGQASNVLSNQALKQGLSQAAPDKVSLEGMGVTPEGKSFINSNIPGLEGISYHPDIHKQLKGFEPPTMTDFFGKEMKRKSIAQRFKKAGAVDTVLSFFDKASQPMKNFLLTLSFFHPLNVGLSFTGRALTSPLKGARGLSQATVSFFSEGATQKIADSFKNKIIKGMDISVFDAGLRAGVNMDRGLPTKGAANLNPVTTLAHATFDRFIYTLKMNLVDMSFGKGKLNPESPQGRAVGNEINLIAGELNHQTMNMNPNTMKGFSRLLLAPSFTASKYKVLGHAVSEGGPAGSLARKTVVGKSIVEGTIATFATLLATGKFPNLQQLLTNYTVDPSIQTNLTDPKGRQLDIGLPSSYLSEPAKPLGGLLKGDPSKLEQYGQSRLNPVLSSAQSLLTGKDFYGRDIANPDSQTPAPLQVAGNIALGKLPIGIQNVVSAMQGKQTPTQAAIGVAGLRTHISPNDPTAQFFSAGGTTTPERQVASYLKAQGASDKEISGAVYHYSAATRLDKLYTAFTYDTRKALAFHQKFQEIAQKDPAAKDAYDDTSSYLRDHPDVTEVQLTQFAKKALDFYNKRVDQQYLDPAKFAEDQQTAQNMQNILPKQQRTLNKRLRKGR